MSCEIVDMREGADEIKHLRAKIESLYKLLEEVLPKIEWLKVENEAKNERAFAAWWDENNKLRAENEQLYCSIPGLYAEIERLRRENSIAHRRRLDDAQARSKLLDEIEQLRNVIRSNADFAGPRQHLRRSLNPKSEEQSVTESGE